MEITADILEELKCDICQDYLSCSPVFSKNNGFTLCGRCFATEEKQDSANRNLKYEAAARLLKFPCKYKDHGCKETVPFAENYQEKVHEETCEYKQYECPVVEACDWLGQQKNILEHCQTVHPDHVMMNPCHLMHDITQFCAKTYIIHCFEVLFLLYTKVCIATGKIYHAVKLLDAPDKVSHFEYILDIKRDKLIFSRPGKVTVGPEENSPIVTSINMLLEFLNGFPGTIFTVRLENLVEDTPIKVVTESPSELSSSCSESSGEVSLGESNYFSLLDFFSPKHFKGRTCRNEDQGCNFRDTDIKCQKHEEFFCRFRTWCWTCWTPVELTSSNAWYAHYLAAHAQDTHEDNKLFDIKSTGVAGRTVFVKTRIGYVICRYYLNNSSFKIYVWSTAVSKNLEKYNVMIKLDTDYLQTSTYTIIEVESVSSKSWDWFGKSDAEDCAHWDINEFKMCLMVNKQQTSICF